MLFKYFLSFSKTLPITSYFFNDLGELYRLSCITLIKTVSVFMDILYSFYNLSLCLNTTAIVKINLTNFHLLLSS